MSDTPRTDAALYPMNGVDIVWPEFARELEIKYNEAKQKNEQYFIWVNQLINERDELKKIVEQRLLVGAEIHDKTNSLIRQSNRTEAECENLRKQLTAATSALRQIHLEVGDWIRSTIIVEE